LGELRYRLGWKPVSVTVGLLRWYAAKLRERGERVPDRPATPKRRKNAAPSGEQVLRVDIRCPQSTSSYGAQRRGTLEARRKGMPW